LNTPPLKLWGIILLTTFVMIVASRLILLLANLPLFHQADNRELLTAFIIGFRFDLAAALITITPPLLLLWLPAPWRLRLVLMTVCKWLTLIVLCIAAGFLWGDLLFFVEANRHITLEPTAILTDWSSMFRMLLRHYLWAAALLVIFWAGLGWWVFRVFKRAKSADAELDGWGWARAAFFPTGRFDNLHRNQGRGAEGTLEIR